MAQESSLLPISIDDVITASTRIQGHIHRTPIMTSRTLDALASPPGEPRQLLFKCEHLQKIGAFKIRGATNAVLQLTAEQRARGVVTHSSGNHAQALALAAREAGTKAYVVMPSSSPQVKKDAVAGYGAQITECAPTLPEREKAAQEIVDKTGATFIHPYNDPRVMAGQGTQMLELLEQAAESGHAPLDAVLVPVGGGGMLSGCATVVKALSPGTKVFGCEPLLANDAAISLATGIRQNQLPPVSVADGLLTALGENGFKVIQQHVDAIYTVTEEEIIRAMKYVWERMKQVIEPSGAVGLAVALYNKEFRALKGVQNVGIILCGGNVQLDRAAALFASLPPEPTPVVCTEAVILLKTRSVPSDPYEHIFLEHGVQPYFVPVLDHALCQLDELTALCQQVANTFSGLIVTSQRSVEALGEILPTLAEEERLQLLAQEVFTVGPATHRAIANLGFTNILGSESGNGDALADFILARTQTRETIRPLLFLVGDKRRDIITRRMEAAKMPLQELVVYKTVENRDFASNFAQAIDTIQKAQQSLTALVFFSPAGANVALAHLKTTDHQTRIACIGPTTERYLVDEWACQDVLVAAKPDAPHLHQVLQSVSTKMDQD